MATPRTRATAAFEALPPELQAQAKEATGAGLKPHEARARAKLQALRAEQEAAEAEAEARRAAKRGQGDAAARAAAVERARVAAAIAEEFEVVKPASVRERPSSRHTPVSSHRGYLTMAETAPLPAPSVHLAPHLTRAMEAVVARPDSARFARAHAADEALAMDAADRSSALSRDAAASRWFEGPVTRARREREALAELPESYPYSNAGEETRRLWRERSSALDVPRSVRADPITLRSEVDPLAEYPAHLRAAVSARMPAQVSSHVPASVHSVAPVPAHAPASVREPTRALSVRAPASTRAYEADTERAPSRPRSYTPRVPYQAKTSPYREQLHACQKMIVDNAIAKEGTVAGAARALKLSREAIYEIRGRG